MTRIQRTVWTNRIKNEEDFASTVYVGLHNAVPYLDQIVSGLLAQRGEFPILMVDNASTDETWHSLEKVKDKFPNRLTISRNVINLGGGGSLLNNLDLIDTEWFTAWHQDDHYLANHAAVLERACRDASSETVCICTNMGSIDASGKKQATPFRASWMLPDFSPETLFVTNLRLHNVPFPASAFRVSEFASFAAPWHSNSFPDTEWVLKACAQREIIFIPETTMLYSENLVSESHSVEPGEKQLGSYVALTRVFASDAFSALTKRMSESDRCDFANAVLTGIDIRLSEPRLGHLLKLQACEQMAFSWNYSESTTNSFLRSTYDALGATQVADLLGTMQLISGDTIEASRTPEPLIVEYLRSLQTAPGRPAKRPIPRYALKAMVALLGVIPERTRRRAVNFLTVRLNLLPAKSPWNFRWK